MSIIVDTVSGDGFARTIVKFLNELTFPNFVEIGGVVSGAVFTNKYGTPYKYIVKRTPPPFRHNGHPKSWELVDRLIDNAFECKIKAGPRVDYNEEYEPDTYVGDLLGGGATTPKALTDMGARAKIIYNPVPAETLNIVDGVKKRGMVPASIVLAHELIHADRILRGTSKLPRPGTVVGPPAQGYIEGFVRLGKTTVDWEHVEVVGFTVDDYEYPDAQVITENQIRAEHNIDLRVNY